MKLKPALTYDQQIAKLVNDHHLKISDTKFAEKILMKINYYRLSGYGIKLKNPNNREYYQDTITIEQLFNLYCFDSQFKNDLMRTIEQIEIELRTQNSDCLLLIYQIWSRSIDG